MQIIANNLVGVPPHYWMETDGCLIGGMYCQGCGIIWLQGPTEWHELLRMAKAKGLLAWQYLDHCGCCGNPYWRILAFDKEIELNDSEGGR